MAVLGQNCYIRAKVALFGQKWLIRESGSNRAQVVFSGKFVVFGQKCLYSGKVVVFA